MPRKERRKRPLFSVLSSTHKSPQLFCDRRDKHLLELELFFQHCIVCEGFLCVVIFGMFEFCSCGKRRGEAKEKTRTKRQRCKDVFLYIFTCIGQVNHWGDAYFGKYCRVTDARQLENLYMMSHRYPNHQRNGTQIVPEES